MIVAAQDQTLTSHATLDVIYHDTDPQCRFCREAPKAEDHLLCQCSVLMQPNNPTQPCK